MRIGSIGRGLVLAWCIAFAAPAHAGDATGASPVQPSEPPVPFGRVIYRAARVAGFESLGITMIACRHRDPTLRRFTVQFFDRAGRLQPTFGTVDASPSMPAGKKVVFVTDGLPFAKRDVVNLRLGHLATGTARVVSDAVLVHCVGKIRMDGGAGSPSYRDEIGLVRDGVPPPVLPNVWRVSPWLRHRD